MNPFRSHPRDDLNQPVPSAPSAPDRAALRPRRRRSPIVLKAARLFDGKADGLITNGMVIVEGKAIKAVGASLMFAEGSTVIDLGDTTLCPGFIDAHTHLTHERTADFNQGFVDRMRREVAEEAIRSTVYARRTVEAGFTTVRDVGSGDMLDVGLRNSIAKGIVPGPRMQVCVHALGAIGGHSDETGSVMIFFRNATRPKESPAGRTSFGRRSASRSNMAPT